SLRTRAVDPDLVHRLAAAEPQYRQAYIDPCRLWSVMMSTDSQEALVILSGQGRWQIRAVGLGEVRGSGKPGLQRRSALEIRSDGAGGDARVRDRTYPQVVIPLEFRAPPGVPAGERARRTLQEHIPRARNPAAYSRSACRPGWTRQRRCR